MPYPALDLPLEISSTQYSPLAWADIAGWSDDDHLAAYERLSRQLPADMPRKPGQPSDSKALGTSLRDPCRIAKGLELSDGAKAKAFFEENFLPLADLAPRRARGLCHRLLRADPRRLARRRTRSTRSRSIAGRRICSSGAHTQSSAGLPNKGAVYRKIGRRKLVPYYDRAEIEDGAIEGRGLEIAWLKNQTDLLFAQIQGSARVEPDGRLDGSHQLRCP